MIEENTLGKKFLSLRENSETNSNLLEVSLASNFTASQSKFKKVISNLMNGLIHYKLEPKAKILILGDNTFIIKAFTLATANLGMNSFLSPQKLSSEEWAEIIREHQITYLFIADNSQFLPLTESIKDISNIRCILTLNPLSEMQKKKIRSLIYFFTLDQIESQGIKESINNPDSYSIICKSQNPHQNVFSYCYRIKNKVKVFSFNSVAILQGILNCEYFLQSFDFKQITLFSFFPWGHPINLLMSILNLYQGKDFVYLDQQNLKNNLSKISQNADELNDKEFILLTNPVELKKISDYFESKIESDFLSHRLEKLQDRFKSTFNSHPKINRLISKYSFFQLKKLLIQDTFYSKLKVIISLENPSTKNSNNKIYEKLSHNPNLSVIKGLVSPQIFGPILINPLNGEKVNSYGLPWGDIEIKKISKGMIKIKTNSAANSGIKKSKIDVNKKNSTLIPLKIELEGDGYFY